MAEEYCIWHPYIGRMDTSTDWGKLFNLVRKNGGMYNFSRLSIIPTRFIGTSNAYKTVSELHEECEKMYREAMRSGQNIR